LPTVAVNDCGPFVPLSAIAPIFQVFGDTDTEMTASSDTVTVIVSVSAAQTWPQTPSRHAAAAIITLALLMFVSSLSSNCL